LIDHKAWLGVGSAAVSSSMYNKIEDKFTAHVSDQFQEDIATRERLATIETEIKNTNSLLKEIRDELRQ
jgi:hypothetical protein